MKRNTSARRASHESGRPSWLYHTAQWIGLAVKESNMKRINVQYFYRLATNLRPLKGIAAGADLAVIYSELYDAEQELEFFLWNRVMPPETSFPTGHKLYELLGELTDNFMREDNLSIEEASAIQNTLSEFETVLAAEFARKDAFYVSKKGIYSTSELIEHAENLFEPEIQERIPEAMPDIQQAGRCLAFELPTAAAFHLFRAIEAVSKQYVAVFRGTQPTGKSELGLGNHVRILRGTDADERAVDTIDQIRRLHRNPVMHPEQSLTMNEVLALLGVAASAILSAVADMEKKAPSPDPDIADILPDPDLLHPDFEPELADEETDDESEPPSSSSVGAS
jgi:hypothetical protein